MTYLEPPKILRMMCSCLAIILLLGCGGGDEVASKLPSTPSPDVTPERAAAEPSRGNSSNTERPNDDSNRPNTSPAQTETSLPNERADARTRSESKTRPTNNASTAAPKASPPAKVEKEENTPPKRASNKRPSRRKTAVTVGDEILEITGEDIDGVEFSLSEYRGKVMMIDFWGDW